MSGAGQPGSMYQPYTAWEDSGLPGLAQMGLDMLAHQFGGAYGQLPFSAGGNYVDIKNRQAFTQAHRIAMQFAGDADRQGWIEAQRAAAKAMGQKWDASTQAAAEARADMVTSSYGLISNSPAGIKFFDQLLGGRSALPLAHAIHVSGQNQYDPATHAANISGNTAAIMAQQIHNTFFGDTYDADGNIRSGASTWRSRTKGLHAHELGQVYSYMSARGYAPGGADYSDVFDLNTDEGREAAAKEHAQRVAGGLKDFSGGVAAMKELLGVGTDTAELLQSLEAMTGGMQQLTPQRAEMLVRHLKAAMEGASIGIEGMLMIGQQSEQIANRIGINQAFGAHLAGHGMNVIEGVNRTGAMGHGYWGLSDMDSLRIGEQARLGRGFASEFGNALGALGNLLDFLPEGGASAEARQFYEDARAGRTDTPLFNRVANMSREELINWVSQNTGLSPTEVSQQFDASSENQRKLYHDAMGTAITEAQRSELGNKILPQRFSSFTGAMIDRLLGPGGDNAELQSAITQAGVYSLMNMTAEERGNSSIRYGTMGASMLEAIKEKAAAGDTQAAALLEQLERQEGGALMALSRMAQAQYGDADLALNNELADILTLHSPEVRDERRLAKERAKLRATQGYALGGLVEGSWMARLGNALREQGAVEGDFDLTKFVKDVLNVEVADDVALQLGSQLQTMEELQEQYAEVMQQDLKPLPNESPEQYKARKAAWQAERKEKMELFRQEGARLRAIIESNPEVKEAYERYQAEMASENSAAQTSIANAELTATNLTLNVAELHINGEVIRDAQGSGKTNEAGHKKGAVV
jgi:hypothetical protein